jgi:hypothetical protein
LYWFGLHGKDANADNLTKRKWQCNSDYSLHYREHEM